MATPTAPRTPDPLTEVPPELMADLREAEEKRRTDALIEEIRSNFVGNDEDHMAQRHYNLDPELDYMPHPKVATS